MPESTVLRATLDRRAHRRRAILIMIREQNMQRLRDHFILTYMLYYARTYLLKVPSRTSSLSGEAYVAELLSQERRRVHEVCRMTLSNFRKLETRLVEAGGLCATRYHSTQLQLCIFLSHVGRAASNRDLSERFQLGGATISRFMNNVLRAILAIQKAMIRLPDPNDLPAALRPGAIRAHLFMPYFQNCLGALDGTHVDATVSERQTEISRNRKGRVTQNVLGVCDLSGRFVYVSAGWEGCAHDGRVYADARAKGLHIPAGKYYLGDAGYALSTSVLTPYRGVRYHLKEQSRAATRPQNAQELFNLRHATLRNVIERQFGVLKKRFRCLDYRGSYPFNTHIKLVIACAVLHNFLIDNNDSTTESFVQDLQSSLDSSEADEIRTPLGDDSSDAARLRNQIADQMWENSQAYLQRRRHTAIRD